MQVSRLLRYSKLVLLSVRRISGCEEMKIDRQGNKGKALQEWNYSMGLYFSFGFACFSPIIGSVPIKRQGKTHIQLILPGLFTGDGTTPSSLLFSSLLPTHKMDKTNITGAIKCAPNYGNTPLILIWDSGL